MRVEKAVRRLKTMVIINPEAGGGISAKRWDEIEAELGKQGIEFEYAFTEGPGHAALLAEEASKGGYERVVAVGGDGTVYEVVNGLMAVPSAKRAVLGVVPCGKGGDFCRTMEIPGELKDAVSLLSSGEPRAIDVGKMTYHVDGDERSGYFANVTGLGFDAEVTDYANKVPDRISRIIGGTPVYLFSLLITYFTYKEADVNIRIDGKQLRAGVSMVITANCQYFGGKMWIAPGAKPDDGLFDIVIMGAGYGNPVMDVSPGESFPERSLLERFSAKLKMLKNIPKVFKGKHIEDPSVVVYKGKSVEVSSGGRLLIQSDGEVIGEAPFSAEVAPLALRLILPPSSSWGT